MVQLFRAPTVTNEIIISGGDELPIELLNKLMSNFLSAWA